MSMRNGNEPTTRGSDPSLSLRAVPCLADVGTATRLRVVELLGTL